MDNMEQIAEAGLFDVILIQPGTYYQEEKQTNEQTGVNSAKIIGTVAERIKKWNAQGKNTKLGLQFEMDMGLVTGRDDPTYSVRSDTKKERINEYLAVFSGLGDSTPLGIYSGGPNEQGYSNIHANNNTHNTGNHRVQDSSQSFEVGQGIPYSEFRFPYSNGNLIYDINNYLFRGIWSDNLTAFGLSKPQ